MALNHSYVAARAERMRATMTTNHKALSEAQELEDTLAHKQDKMTREFAACPAQHKNMNPAPLGL